MAVPVWWESGGSRGCLTGASPGGSGWTIGGGGLGIQPLWTLCFWTDSTVSGASPSSLLQQSSRLRPDLYPSCCVCGLHSLPHSAVSWCLPPSIAGECLQTPIVPHGTSQGPLLCADGGHAVCPGRSLLTGRLRAAGQSSEGCTSGACAPWRGPRTRSSHSLGWLAAPSQVNLRIVPGLTLWAEQEVLDFFLSLHPSPGRLLNTPFPLSFWGGRRSQGLKAGEGLLKFTPRKLQITVSHTRS